jgi:hypothetical protein
LIQLTMSLSHFVSGCKKNNAWRSPWQAPMHTGRWCLVACDTRGALRQMHSSLRAPPATLRGPQGPALYHPWGDRRPVTLEIRAYRAVRSVHLGAGHRCRSAPVTREPDRRTADGRRVGHEALPWLW